MLIKPTGNRLLCTIHEIPTDSAIIRPGSKKDTPNNPYGLVIDRGPDCKLYPIGSKVLFYQSNATGLEDKPRDRVLFLVGEDCIIATLEDEVEVLDFGT